MEYTARGPSTESHSVQRIFAYIFEAACERLQSHRHNLLSQSLHNVCTPTSLAAEEGAPRWMQRDMTGRPKYSHAQEECLTSGTCK